MVIFLKEMPSIHIGQDPRLDGQNVTMMDHLLINVLLKPAGYACSINNWKYYSKCSWMWISCSRYGYATCMEQKTHENCFWRRLQTGDGAYEWKYFKFWRFSTGSVHYNFGHNVLKKSRLNGHQKLIIIQEMNCVISNALHLNSNGRRCYKKN